MTKQDHTVILQGSELAGVKAKAEAGAKDLEPVQVGTGIIVEFEYGGWVTTRHIASFFYY